MSRPPGDPIPNLNMPDGIEAFLIGKEFALYCIACSSVFAKPNSDRYLVDLGKYHLNSLHGKKFKIPKLKRPHISGRFGTCSSLM